jgi:hypothetical protein
MSHIPAPSEVEESVDATLGLKLISIRLPVGMIDDYKLVAEIRGCLYQPLMREAMAAWIDEAKTNILMGLAFNVREDARLAAKTTLTECLDQNERS